MRANIPDIGITALVAALPQDVFEIMSLGESQGEKKIKRLIKSTGVERVHVADDKTTTADLCVFAAQYMFSELNIDKSSIDAVVFVCETPDYIHPGTSCLLQDRLGLSKDVAVFDINHGCSAYIYGLYQAAMLVNCGGCRKVLLCVGDTPSLRVNKKDMSMRVLMGDAGTVSIVEKGESTLSFVLKTDGAGYRHLFTPAGGGRMLFTADALREREDPDGNIRRPIDMYMDGLEIMNFALREVPTTINELLDFCGWKKDEVDTFALHQANKMLLNYLIESAGLPAEKTPVNLAGYGNTGAATIPLLLCAEHRNLRARGGLGKIVACGFGSGLSWGAVNLELSATNIFEPVIYGGAG